MNMRNYLDEHPREVVEDLAERVGTKYVYLTQIASGFRRPSRILALSLERESNGQIKANELRPDDSAKGRAA